MCEDDAAHVDGAVAAAVAARVQQLKQKNSAARENAASKNKWTHKDACEGMTKILKISMVKYKAICALQNS